MKKRHVRVLCVLFLFPLLTGGFTGCAALSKGKSQIGRALPQLSARSDRREEEGAVRQVSHRQPLRSCGFS